MVKGRKIEFYDKFHNYQRKIQIVYDREISRIMEDNSCNKRVAQRILRKRKLLEKLEQVEKEEKESDKNG